MLCIVGQEKKLCYQIFMQQPNLCVGVQALFFWFFVYKEILNSLFFTNQLLSSAFNFSMSQLGHMPTASILVHHYKGRNFSCCIFLCTRGWFFQVLLPLQKCQLLVFILFKVQFTNHFQWQYKGRLNRTWVELIFWIPFGLNWALESSVSNNLNSLVEIESQLCVLFLTLFLHQIRHISGRIRSLCAKPSVET